MIERRTNLRGRFGRQPRTSEAAALLTAAIVREKTFPIAINADLTFGRYSEFSVTARLLSHKIAMSIPVAPRITLGVVSDGTSIRPLLGLTVFSFDLFPKNTLSVSRLGLIIGRLLKNSHQKGGWFHELYFSVKLAKGIHFTSKIWLMHQYQEVPDPWDKQSPGINGVSAGITYSFFD